MAFASNFEASNTADLFLNISATDGDQSSATYGQTIDFTGATFNFVVQDDNGVNQLTASLGSGITQPTSTAIQVHFTPAQMQTLAPGSYSVGMVYKINDQINQLLTGKVSVYDGIATL